MFDMSGQRPIGPEEVGAVPISPEIYHLVGAIEGTIIDRPAMREDTDLLVIIAQKGTWNVRIGEVPDSAGMPSLEDPPASVNDGTGALKLVETDKWVLPSADRITVSSYAADSVLTYFWV